MVLPRRWVGERTELVDAFAPSGPGLRDADRDQRGDDPVLDDHADEPPTGAATSRRPALNAPDASWSNHPRSARRLAFDRTPSTFAATVVIDAQRRRDVLGPCRLTVRPVLSTFKIRWLSSESTDTGSPSRQGGTTVPAQTRTPAQERGPLPASSASVTAVVSSAERPGHRRAPRVRSPAGPARSRRPPTPQPTGRLLPQALHPLTGSRFPLLQQPQHRRHRAPLDHEAETERRDASLNPIETMPDQQKLKDHIRFNNGF